MAKKDQTDSKPVPEMHVMTDGRGAVRHISQEDWDSNHVEYLAAGFSRPEGIKDTGNK